MMRPIAKSGINDVITSMSCAESVLGLLEERRDEFSLVNTITAIHRIAKCRGSEPSQANTMMKHISPIVSGRISEC